jgi:PAS domain S-box-containing protein
MNAPHDERTAGSKAEPLCMHDLEPENTTPSFDGQMLQAAMQTAVGAVIIINEKGQIQNLNPACETIFGFSRAEILGQSVNLLMPEPYRSRHDDYIRHHLETGERKIIGIGRQVMGRRKSGAIFPMHLSVSTFQSGDKRYFTGIVIDLTHQRPGASLPEQALFQAIFNHLPDAVLVIDPTDRIMLCNRAVTRVFGYAPEEVIGHPAAMLCATKAERLGDGTLIRHLQTGVQSGAPMIISYKRKSGEEFPCETVASGLLDEQGRLVGCVSLNRDISRQVVQDEALRKSQRMEAIGQLTGGIAHDFNNLLTIITGNHELLEMDLQDAGQRDLLKRANDAALMGARLTHRLLTFARRRRLDPVVLDLNEQVLSMAELLRRSLGEAIALGTLLVPHLWAVRADPSEVENAVLNLAINARDAMPNGGKLVIETANVVLVEQDLAKEIGVIPGDYVRLSVSDTGVGMSPEVLARVFEPFFTTKETGKGTGLGLSVIYGFVKQSGGHVTAYSEVGKGTTVNLYLPRAGALDDKGAPAKENLALGVTGETILLVEDNLDVRNVTAKRIKNLGYTVIEADNAAAAIAVLQSGQRIDLVFSDVVMPGGMSGFDLAQWTRRNAPGVRVLLSSGFAEDVARGGEVLARDLEILRKPYAGSALAQALRRTLERR